MNQCDRLSDRIPLVGLGRSEWTEEESRHLEECASCRQEWELVRSAGRLGEGLIARIDPAATSVAVLRRLGPDRTRPSRGRVWAIAGLAAAAAVALVLRSEQPSRPEPSTGAVAARLEFPLPELDSLRPAELDSLLRNLERPAAETPDAGDVGLEDFDNGLDPWEG